MSTKIPQAFIDEVLTKTDIVDLINQHIPLKKQGSSYVACCPFHTEKTPSFNVIPKKQFYHCFGCGANGNAISFIMQYLNQSFLETIATLASSLQLTIPRNNTTQYTEQTKPLQRLLLQITQNYQRNLQTIGKHATDHLKQRGISDKTAQQYQLGYAPLGFNHLTNKFPTFQQELIATGMLVHNEENKIYDRFRGRLMFPIQNRQGKVIAFGGRSLDDAHKPKYLNSPETNLFQKNRELYGLYHVLQQKPQPLNIIVVEGYMDVIALAEHGINNAVATLGTATSNNHINLLNQYTKSLYFCFDGDAAGKKAAWRALEVSLEYLATGLEPLFIFLPEGQDPDSLVRTQGGDAFRTYMANAIPLYRFFFDTLLQNIDKQTLSGKSQLLHAAKPYLQALNTSPYLQLMLEELARITRIEPMRVQQLILSTKSITRNTAPNIKRTPQRIAMALLLQNPQEMADFCVQLDLTTLQHPDFHLIANIMQRIAADPTISPATLVEYWRDTPFFDELQQLITWDTQIPGDANVNELKDILQFLHKQIQENNIQTLLNKARTQGLSDAERYNLQQKLAARHGIKPLSH